MPKYLVTLQRTIEVECQDEGYAISVAIELGGSKSLWGGDYSAEARPEWSVVSVECVSDTLELPPGKFVVDAVEITYCGHDIDLTNKATATANVYPAANNPGKWGCKLNSLPHDIIGQLMGYDFSLKEALRIAHNHCGGKDANLSEVYAAVNKTETTND